jgi:hypothetical protein
MNPPSFITPHYTSVDFVEQICDLADRIQEPAGRLARKQ